MSHFIKSIELLKQYGVFCSFLLLVVITILSLTPVVQEVPITGIDKVLHLLAYCALTFPISLSYSPRYRFIFWFSCLWGGIIEIIQPIVGRQADTIDALVNTIGVFFGIVLASILLKTLDTNPSPSDE
jgi:VanZ family protein